MEILKVIGKRIKEKRKELKYSQEYLAELAELSRNYVGNIERGEKQASVCVLKKISGTIKLPLEKMFKGF